MTRECSQDFIHLQSYIGDYSIGQNLKENSYTESLKTMHKSYFSAITWHAEMSYRRAELLSKNELCTNEIIDRISETVSDLGASLFNWLNGSYKTSRVMLRAAIENFVRATSALEDKQQLIEKNVYQLFERANKLSIFNQHSSLKTLYTALHADYKLLCLDTHTATTDNMEHLSSLAGLPIYKKKKATDSKEIYVRVSKNLTGIFCLLFNDLFHSMHHKNRENIFNGLNAPIKALISDFRQS
jgi:hypothetical protein